MTKVTVIKREKTENHEYKYLVRKGIESWTAFHTESGFNKFMDMLELEEERKEINNSVDYGKVEIITYKEKNIEEIHFWNKNELGINNKSYSWEDGWKDNYISSEDFKRFIGLSNGSYVDCYYKTTKDKVIIARPNPNAKEVYKEYDYFKMAKIWG